MSQLILKLRPFTKNLPSFFINEKGETIPESFEIKNINSYIFSHPGLTDVTFIGNRNFISKFAERAKENELKFNQTNITYHIQEK